MAEGLENCAISATPTRRRKVEFPVKGVAIALIVVAFAVLAFLLVPRFFGSSDSHASGNLTIIVRDQSGEPVPNAAILIGPARDLPEKSIEISDAHSSHFQSGQFSTNTDISGASHIAYRANPQTRVQILVEAESFSRAEQAVTIPQDSVVVVLTRLASASHPGENTETAEVAPLTILLHDRAGNPITSAIVTMLGRSGKEYSARTDPRGRAILEDYQIAAEGESPSVRIAVNQFKTVLRGKPKPIRIRPGSETSLDINDFVPYDQTLQEVRGSVESVYDEMRAARERVSGAEDARKSDPDYRQALDLEQRGQRQFDQNDFDGARGSFMQAKTLYARAAERLANQTSLAHAEPAAKSTDKSDPEHTEPTRTESPKKEIAQPDMRGIVERCKSSFEKEDLAGLSALLRFNKNEQSTWSTFFDIAEDVQVTTDAGSLQSDNENAHIGFGLTISYENRLDGERRKLVGDMSIGLHYANGRWDVVSHQFKNR
jgi:hypothetical protein